MPEFLPTTEAELAAIVREAAAKMSPLAVNGGGTRRGLGHPVQAAADLSTRMLTGVTLYEPAELVLSARAGTPVVEVERLLAKHGQRLAFEPMDHRVLLGTPGEPTVGGLAAANVTGPRRIVAGAARDALIGIRAANGSGEIIRSGGRVMKNVTGYDLVKLLAGSYGTLAVLSEVTFKVLPRPEDEASLVLRGLSIGAAIAAMAAALASPFEVSGAAHIPGGDGAPARTALRLEGRRTAVADRCKRLVGQLRKFGEADMIDAAASASLWAKVRDVEALDIPPGAPLWRVALRPSLAPKVAAAIAERLDGKFLFDWGGALIWFAGGTGADAGAEALRAALGDTAHATLVRAPGGLAAGTAMFPPLASPAMELSRRVKLAFDPAGILNPGRMYPGL